MQCCQVYLLNSIYSIPYNAAYFESGTVNCSGTLSFTLTTSFVVNNNGSIIDAYCTSPVTVRIENGIIVSTSGTSVSGKDTSVSQSNNVSATVTDFKFSY